MAALVPTDYGERVGKWREQQRRDRRLTLLMLPLIVVLGGLFCGVGYYVYVNVVPDVRLLVAAGAGTVVLIVVGLHRLMLAVE